MKSSIEIVNCENPKEFLSEVSLHDDEGDFLYRGQLYGSESDEYRLLPSAWRNEIKSHLDSLWKEGENIYNINIPEELEKMESITSRPSIKDLKLEIAKQSLAEMLLLNIFSRDANHLGLFVSSTEPFDAFGKGNKLERWVRFITEGIKEEDNKRLSKGYLLSPNHMPDGYLGRNLKIDANVYLMLSLAQHYGIPTRLLDWSKNPLKACYFAASSHKKKDNDLKISVIRLNIMKANNLNICKIDSVPYHYNKHLSLQEGVFTYLYHADYYKGSKFISLEDKLSIDNISAAPSLKVFQLSLDHKDALLDALNRLGVTGNSLMPSYSNVSKKILDNLKHN